MYELKKFGKVFTSKFVGTGPSSYKKRIYRAAVSRRLRNTGIERLVGSVQQVAVLSVVKINRKVVGTYEGWNFNSGNYLFTTDTK